MSAFVGPLSMICGVLVVAGVAKIVSPRPTRQAMALITRPVPPFGVRVLGIVEICLAVATITWGGTVLPILVGATYLSFAAVVMALLRRPGGASCGCFGSLDTPVSGVHLGANLLSAAIAFAAVGAPGLGRVLAEQPGSGVAYLLLVAAGTMAAVAVLTLLPRLGARAAVAPAFSLRASR